MSNLVACNACKKELLINTPSCPYCNASDPTKNTLSLTKKLLIGFALLTCFLAFSSSFTEGIGVLKGYAIIYFIYWCFRRALKLKNEQGGWFKNQPDSEDDTAYAGQPERLSNWKSGLDTLWSGSKEISFDYEDYNGNITSRALALKHLYIDKNGDFVFKGFCKLRQSHRSFKIDSIISDVTFSGKEMNPYLFIEDELGIVVDASSDAENIDPLIYLHQDDVL